MAAPSEKLSSNPFAAEAASERNASLQFFRAWTAVRTAVNPRQEWLKDYAIAMLTDDPARMVTYLRGAGDREASIGFSFLRSVPGLSQQLRRDAPLVHSTLLEAAARDSLVRVVELRQMAAREPEGARTNRVGIKMWIAPDSPELQEQMAKTLTSDPDLRAAVQDAVSFAPEAAAALSGTAIESALAGRRRTAVRDALA